MTPSLLGWPAGLPEVLDAAMDTAAASAGLFGPARSAELDAGEEFPTAECEVLDRCGIARAYVPAELGGLPGGLPELLQSLRTVARRDVTVAVAHGKTFLGSVSTWVAGSDEQRRALARLVVEEDAVVAWGLTEPERGSDLLAGRLTAVAEEDGGWRLDGVKWPINNATRGRLVSVLARTSPQGGTRGFSLFLVDKSRLGTDGWQPLPKEPTHGIRGADISGIRFDDVAVAPEALTGRVGDGLETVLRALQLTRTVCTSLSLGAGEHAFRLARDFAAERVMYGTHLIELPLARRVLGRAGAALVLADAASLMAVRSAHCLTGEMSVVSALAKAGVPDIVQQTIDELAEFLGARGFLRTHHAHGMFQKLERDHRIVAIFDGSTAVNRSALIAQFLVLERMARSGRHDEEGLAAARDTATLPTLDTAALRLLSRTGCSVVQGLPATARRLGELTATGALPARAHELADALADEIASVARAMAGRRPVGQGVPAEDFATARRYELCFAGASAAHLLLAAPGGGTRATHLMAALERALELLRPGHEAPPEAYDRLLAPPAAAKELVP
ncbi:acyl-CoA dehydrogenase family protein [Streptomyces tsukubensis]|uniref:Acyl-CoA dehydrogenase n=1 Tax=Streptomyces tsukubensis TaxID=83656 RepID=A0A1V4AER8_9ACTN|nr:acyl-CoA dehydrogenase [Streptomyces tsukubensis]OON82594.1 hypothetical protein B1H18_00495 [Streptomyces tsukubensis]QFR92242.1 acyl-CoA dehydrogenase [Streptomyces tsukubensis]